MQIEARGIRTTPKRIFSVSIVVLLALGSFSPAYPSYSDRIQRANPRPDQTATQTSDVRRIEIGKPVEREIRGAESHTYQITLKAGQYLKVTIDQRGIDLKVIAIAADGKHLFEFNSESRKQGQETVTIVAEATGTYRLEVEPVGEKIAAGRYEIRVTELRTATEQDRQSQAARKLFDESVRLWRKGQRDAALPLAQQALEIRQKALGPDHPDVAQSLNLVAVLYRGNGDNARAERFYQQALAIREKSLGPDHPSIATLLTNLANLYHSRGDYSKAEPLYQRALAIQEKVLEADHPDVADALRNLGVLYFHKGDYSRAEPLYQRALAVTEKALGPEHPDVAESLHDLALLYDEKGDYAKAEPLYRRALGIREKTLGPEHSDVADSLNNLAIVYWNQGDYARAEPLFLRALGIREKTLGADHPDVASSLNNLANLYKDKDDYAKAEPLLLRALAIREKRLKPDHPEVAGSLNNLASLYHAKGDYAKAEPLYQRGLAIREKALGPAHPDVSDTLNNLALLYSAKGDYSKAEPLYLRAITIKEKALGTYHPGVADLLSNAANLYKDKSDYIKAEPLYLRALAIKEKALGANNLGIAGPLTGLANLYHAKGDFDKSEPLYRRAAAIYEKSLGPNHSDVARSLNNLASNYVDQGQYLKAEPVYKRVLAILEKSLGSDHSDVAYPLIGLANLYTTTGDYPKAEPLYKRAAAIAEKAVGPDNPQIASALIGLATLYWYEGDYDKAEPLYRRALAIREKALGPDHPDVAQSFYALAVLYSDKGDQARAIENLSRSAIVSERNIALNLNTGSERQKLLYLATQSGQTNDVISLNARSVAANALALDLAVTTVLQRKGRVLDAMTDTIGALRRRASPADRELIDQLIDARAQLSKKVLGGPANLRPDQYRIEIKRLEDQVEELEAEISGRSREFRSQSQAVTLGAVQAAIPNAAALVEFVLYRPRNPKPKRAGEEFGEPRYVAYVIRNHGEPVPVELGEAKEIDGRVDALRKALRDPERNDVKQLARAADRKVMEPVRKLLGRTRQVFLSPDAELNVIPFASLVDERNRYLVERYSLTYLTSGRDLLRLNQKFDNRQNAMVLGDPDFGGDITACSDRKLELQGSAVDFSRVLFCPLPGTAGEAQALQALIPDAKVLTGERATEAVVKQATAPKILHIATHGFFLEDVMINTGSANRGVLIGSGKSGKAMKVENPLLRSGLALAGANLHKSGADDGILTALEAAGLDLWGTKLVVLSACDSGVGEVRNGDGVYGLRRALLLAGSESQVMSLWPVSDTATRDLMIDYYTRLRGGEGRSEALRQVQLRLLRDPKRRHPYYWANFIESGEWANLDGKR